MPTVEIPLEDRRFRNVQRVQMAQDVVGVVVLAPAALMRLQTGPFQHKLLGMLEAAAIALAVASAARELLSRERNPAYITPAKTDARIDLTNLLIGIALLSDWAFSAANGHKRFAPALLIGLSAVVFAFVRPFMQSRVKRRRVLCLDDTGLYMSISPFRKIRLQWSEVEEIEDAGTVVRFHLAKGVRDVSLRRFDNAEELRRAILTQARALSLPVTFAGMIMP